jgi:hypothetical protein
VALDTKAVIGKVAERYGILLGPDDPIFASLYLYELAFEDHLERLEEASDTSAIEIMTMVKAELAGGRNAAPTAITAASALLMADLRKEVAKVQLAVQRTLLTSLLCLGGSAIMFAGTALLWLSR